jgi:hypothetical protein
MNRFDKWSGAFGVLIGLGFCISSTHLGLGQMSEPGPGFLPFLVGGILFLLSATLFIRGLGKGSDGTGKRMGRAKRFQKVFYILLALIFYNVGLSFIGFSLTTFFFVVSMMRLVEAQGWRKTLVTALLVSVGFFGVFQSWLQLDIPVGPWGF